jgi:heterodisulfide reductase subunit B
MTRPLLLYPGCTVLGRFPEYEAASKRILTRIGIELRTLDQFCCCGASLAPGIWENWVHLPAYTLAQAEKNGLDLLTLCGGCTNTFRRAIAYLKSDPRLLEKTNQALVKLDLSYSGVVQVRHLIDVLEEHLPTLSQRVKQRLDRKVALSPPCQVFLPTRLQRNDKNSSESMRRIAETIGLRLVDYPHENDCCGSTLLTVDTPMALHVGASKLRSAIEHGADVVCLACGNCLFLLDRHQKKAGIEGRIPVISLSELVERAM